MECVRRFAAAAGDHVELFAKLGNEAAHHLGVAGKIGGCGIDRGMKRHGLSFLWVAGCWGVAFKTVGIRHLAKRRDRLYHLSGEVSRRSGLRPGWRGPVACELKTIISFFN